MIDKNYVEEHINNLEKSLYPNITYLIKNELTNFIMIHSENWKKEIFSQNKQNKKISSLKSFYEIDKNITINTLSNNDKFTFFINEFIKLTLRLYNHLLTYDELHIRLETHDQFYVEYKNRLENKKDLLESNKKNIKRLITKFNETTILFKQSNLTGDLYKNAYENDYKPEQILTLNQLEKARNDFHLAIKMNEIESIRSKIEKINDIRIENFKYGIESNKIILTNKQKKILFKDYFIRLRGISKTLNISLYNLFIGEPNKKSKLIDLLITLNHFKKDEICINRNFDKQYKNELSHFTDNLNYLNIISPKINQISFNNDIFINSKNLIK